MFPMAFARTTLFIAVIDSSGAAFLTDHVAVIRKL